MVFAEELSSEERAELLDELTKPHKSKQPVMPQCDRTGCFACINNR